MLLDYPLWLRATHFFNFLFLSLLVRSGIEILSAHPRLYWNDHCTPGSEWLKFTKKRRPTDRLWIASDEESSFPPLIALPGRENLGLGRHWHFLADFAWLLTGLVYIVMLFVSPEWRRLIPASWQIVPDAGRAMISYLTLHIVETPGTYNALQQLTYAAVVFLLAPFSIATGIAMSPAIAARFPWYIKIFHGRQSARSLHFLALGGVHPVLHRPCRARGPARFPQRTGGDCFGRDAQPTFGARADCLAVRLDRHRRHACRDDDVLAPKAALCPDGHAGDHRSVAHADFRPSNLHAALFARGHLALLLGERAAHLLGDLKDPRGVAILVPLLNDPDVSDIVPWSLGQIGDRSAITPLIGSLTDPNPSMRVLAIHALVDLKASEALPRLRQLLDDNARSNFGKLESVAEAAQAAIAKLLSLN
jgi:hypothetical protein